MEMQQLVVGFDGSPMSMHAVEWAADEAARRSAPLRIVACHETFVAAPMSPVAGEAVGSLIEAVTEGARRALEAVARRHPGLDAVVDVNAGAPAQILAEASERANLVVVGASRHRGAAAFWLGSTARSVVRRSACPVVVVHDEPSPGPATRVVVGIDGSAEAAAAVRWAADEADVIGAPVLIVHCWWDFGVPGDPATMPGRDLAQVDEARLLDEAVEAARDRCGVDVQGRLVEQSAVPGLLAACGSDDLLVVGSPTHGAILSRMLGSTVNGVLEGARQPVVVVPTAAAASTVGRRTHHGARQH
jgi:nucleotide-binding universal stress UspA family protein